MIQCHLTRKQDPAWLFLDVDVYRVDFSNKPKPGTSVFSQPAIFKSPEGAESLMHTEGGV